MITNTVPYKHLLDKIEEYHKKEAKNLLVYGIQMFIILSLGSFFLFCLIEMLLFSSSTVRTIFLFILIVASLYSLYLFVVSPLLVLIGFRKYKNLNHSISVIGKKHTEVNDDLTNAISLADEEKQVGYYSNSLIEAAFFQIYGRLKDIDFTSVINFEKPKKLFQYTAFIIIAITGLFLASNGLRFAGYRILNPNTQFLPPQKFYFVVSPGNMKILKGNNVEIKINVKGYAPDEVQLALKNIDEPKFNFVDLKKDSTGSYVYLVKNTLTAFNYYASAEDIKSEEYKIDVVNNPSIKSLSIKINPPVYSGLPSSEQLDNGNISTLAGSRISLSLSSSKNLKSAFLFFDDSTKLDLSVNEDAADIQFQVKKDVNYKIILTDNEWYSNESPISYTIKTLSDAFPTLEVVEPGKNTDLSNDNRLPLLLRISDDYGFSNLKINYKILSVDENSPNQKYESVNIDFDKRTKDAEVTYIWNLSRLEIGANEVVSYYIEVFDNDNVNGPKSTRSSEYLIRVPSLEEILAQTDQTHKDADADLKQVLKEADDLKKDLEKLDQDLKQDKRDLTWQEKEKVENTLEKFKNLQEKVESVKDNLAEMQQKLTENNLLSKETLSKYMELQKLMDEMTTDEMKKTMEKLQNMLQQMNRKMTQDALQNMKFDEESFRNNIERTMNLLKRVQAEQKLDEMVKRTDNITKKEEQVSQKLNENKMNESLENQKDITEDVNKLEEELKNLEDIIKDLKDVPKDQLEQMKQEFEKANNEQLSMDIEKNIQQNQKQQAQQNQQQLSSNMKQMQKNLQNMQNQMSQQNMMEAFNNMMKMMDNLITLSKQQEDLRNETKQNPNSSFGNEGNKQSGLENNLDKITKQLGDLSQKSFAVSPEMGKALGDAKRQMNEAMKNMSSRNLMASLQNQQEAMRALNEAASMMKSSMESMMSGGQGGGMAGFMQQLSQMAQQQMQLNNMTQMLQQMQQGQLSPQQQSELQRLSQQQDIIRKSLEQLNKEARQSGESKRIPQNLENISKEMQEIVTDMESQKLDDGLVQKQEKILSRLLDAQRSMNERDFEKNRESFTSKNITKDSPGKLDLSNSRNQLKDELSKVQQEGYNKDYESIIRKYFNLLEK